MLDLAFFFFSVVTVLLFALWVKVKVISPLRENGEDRDWRIIIGKIYFGAVEDLPINDRSDLKKNISTQKVATVPIVILLIVAVIIFCIETGSQISKACPRGWNERECLELKKSRGLEK